MAGVSLDDEPHFAARYKLQRIASGEREVNFHLDAAIDSSRDDYISSL